jgi:hypothetical protein
MKISRKYRIIKAAIRRFYQSHVIDRVNPQQKWLRKKLPRHFCDLDRTFELTLFHGLIFFWEKDNGKRIFQLQIDVNVIPEELEHRREFMTDEAIESAKKENQEIYNIINAAYEWAKIRDEKYESLYDRNFPIPAPYTAWYQYEDEYLIPTDTLHLQNIIKYRKYLWS